MEQVSSDIPEMEQMFRVIRSCGRCLKQVFVVMREDEQLFGFTSGME